MAELPDPGASLYERYKEALRRGHVAALRNRLPAALAAYADAADLAPDRALPHASLAAVLHRLGRLDEALAAFDQALARAPGDDVALDGRAETLIGLGRPSEAAQALDRRAEVLDAAGRLADACDAARRALELAESRTRRRVVEVLAGRLREQPQDEAAAGAVERALRLLDPPRARRPVGAADDTADPRADAADAAAAAALHATEAAAGPVAPEPEPADGIELALEAVAALDAGDRTVALGRFLAAADAHRRVGRRDAALDACYEALAIAPADVEVHVVLADVWLDRGWRALAVDKTALLERFVDLAPNDPARERVVQLARDRLPDEPRLAGLRS